MAVAAPATLASAPAEPSLPVTSGHLRPSASDLSGSPPRGSAARPQFSLPPSVHLIQGSSSLPLAVSPIQATVGGARLMHFRGSLVDPSPVLGRGNKAPPQGMSGHGVGLGSEETGASVKTTENAQTVTSARPPAGPSGGGQVTTQEVSRGCSAAGGAFCLTLGPNSGASLPARIPAAPHHHPAHLLGTLSFMHPEQKCEFTPLGSLTHPSAVSC